MCNDPGIGRLRGRGDRFEAYREMYDRPSAQHVDDDAITRASLRQEVCKVGVVANRLPVDADNHVTVLATMESGALCRTVGTHVHHAHPA